MKKRLELFFAALFLMIGLAFPDMQAYAASGKTTLAVSSGSLNIGDSVTVTAKAFGASGETAYANMTLTYDSGILEFVSCTATYGGGGGSISAATDAFSVTFKAVSAGTASVSLSASDGVVYDTAEELESMAGSSATVTVKNEASGTSDGNGSSGSSGTTSAAQSADNSLKSLTISPGTLSPAFSGSTVKYTATVDNSVTSVAVSAEVANEKATVESVSGNTNLAVGKNIVKIVVKAENGTTATYQITVTRQAQAAAETPSETPEKTDEPEESTETVTETEETAAAEVTVNGTAYRISEDFAEEEIPEDFTENTVNFRGTAYRGLVFDKGTLSLLYLAKEDNAGKFFVYDETRDILYDFVKFTSGESGYVIALAAPVDAALPDSYEQTSLQLADGALLAAYRLPATADGEASEFYLFYGVNRDGVEGWYQYDSAEGTYQRVSGEISGDSEEDTELSALQDEYNTLYGQYKAEKAKVRNIVICLIFAAAVAVVVLLNIFLFRKKKEKNADELEEQSESGGGHGADDDYGVDDDYDREDDYGKNDDDDRDDDYGTDRDYDRDDDYGVNGGSDKEDDYGADGGSDTDDDYGANDDSDKDDGYGADGEDAAQDEKEEKTSVKKEKGLEVWDLNDL